MTHPSIRALLFDVLGTVVDWRSGVVREVSAFLTRHAGDSIDPRAFTDAWNRRYGPATEAVRNGGRPFVPLDILHRENLEATLVAFGRDPAALPEAELGSLNLAWHRLDPWPDALAGLGRLKTRFILAPLSAGNTSLLLDIARHAGLPWDTILGADVVGAYKPAPQAYRRTVELLGLRPEEACLVAAHNDDLAAARACGLRTAFVPRPLEHGPGQGSDLRAEQAWDIVTADLVDLAEKLGV